MDKTTSLNACWTTVMSNLDCPRNACFDIFSPQKLYQSQQWTLNLINDQQYHKVIGIKDDIPYPGNSKICGKEDRNNKTLK